MISFRIFWSNVAFIIYTPIFHRFLLVFSIMAELRKKGQTLLSLSLTQGSFNNQSKRSSFSNDKSTKMTSSFSLSIDLETNFGQVSNKFPNFAQVEVDTLDYDHYLPLFLDGLCETQHPYEFLARKGAEELIARSPDRVAPLLAVVIPPLRRALNTRNPHVICATLKILQLIATCSKEAGRGLLNYYKSLLPVLNLFKVMNRTFTILIFTKSTQTLASQRF